jgi:AAA+ ATPase superfamily predicted ATPase
MARLKTLTASSGPNVAVIWGRRRVGKTRLLLEWVEKHRGIYYMADESTAAIQRRYFALAVQQVIANFADVEYPDWTTLLARLAKDSLHAKWRGPIVIDELPYLISVSPELPSILQKWIDHDAKKAKLIVVFCGSSQQMMQGAVLDATSPLYGRANEIMKLGPISPCYMKEALKIKKNRDVIESYAIWGGVPRYWELVERTKGSFFDIIEKLVLDPMGPLHEEPNRLLLEEFPSAIHLRPILDAIGLGSHRLSEIAARIEQPGTSLMRPIQKLIELDLIQRETPYGVDAHHSKKTLYKIKDPFIRFWFDVVAPRRSFLSQATTRIRHEWLKKYLPHLFGIMWEELCRLAIPLLTPVLDGIFYGEAGRFWQNKGPEWDVLAKEQEGLAMLIGEAKWTTKTPSPTWIYKTIQDLKNKGIPPIAHSANTQFVYVLFVPEKPKGLKLPQGIKVVDAKDVLQALK